MLDSSLTRPYYIDYDGDTELHLVRYDRGFWRGMQTLYASKYKSDCQELVIDLINKHDEPDKEYVVRQFIERKEKADG